MRLLGMAGILETDESAKFIMVTDKLVPFLSGLLVFLWFFLAFTLSIAELDNSVEFVAHEIYVVETR